MQESLITVGYDNLIASIALVLTAKFQQEGGRWLAECLELGTTSYATTLEKAREELLEAVQLQLSEITDLGFIDEFLRDHGVRPVSIKPPKQPMPPGLSWVTPQPAGVN